jgi:hypothetical protein
MRHVSNQLTTQVREMKAPQLHGQHNVKASIIINTPISTAWDVLQDFGNVSDWAPTVTRSHYLSEQTSGAGTGRHCDIEGFGSIEETVSHWQEGRGFAYSVTPLGPLAASNSSWWLTRVDDQTTKLEVVLSYDIRFGLFGRILHKLVMRKKLQQSLPQTVAATKKHVEGIYTPAPLSTPDPMQLSAVTA